MHTTCVAWNGSSARWAALFGVLASLLAGCGPDGQTDEELSEEGGTDDLDLGQIEEGVDGYGYATQCKPIPDVDPLVDPEITVSLDGLTLHLVDHETGYDRVFPIGVGELDDGESLTPTSDGTPSGTFFTGQNTTEVTDSQWGYYYPCRIWWRDPETGKKKPVFAGLPFIRLAGPPTAGYGIHGPVDNYAAANGGSLRRGYVSHGCVRMAAADIVEVYGRIQHSPKTPVRIQREVERRDDGTAVDLEPKWIGAECWSDEECGYAGGVCRLPESGGAGTCTRACAKYCPDVAGEATTFCVPEPSGGTGMCMPKASATFNAGCGRYDGRLGLEKGVWRPDGSAKADVCMPAH